MPIAHIYINYLCIDIVNVMLENIIFKDKESKLKAHISIL